MLSVITPAQVGPFQQSYGFPATGYSDFAIQQQKWQQMSQAFKQQQSSLWSAYQPNPTSYPSIQSGRSQQPTPQQTSSTSRGLVMPPPGAATKDYSKPLFVDCSIEYELPNAPKIPKNSEPILMIHPSYPKKKASTAQQPTQQPSVMPQQCSAPNCRCNLRKRLHDKVQRRYHPVQAAVKRTYDCIHEERKANANYKHFLLNSNQGLFPQQFGFAPTTPLRRPLDAPPAPKRSRMNMMPYPAIQQSLSYPLQTWGYPQQQITPPDTYMTDTYWGRPMYDQYVQFSAQQQFYYPRKQSVCLGCVQGKCPQQTVQWNKENMGLMRSL